MMWFRHYADDLNDRQLQLLPAELFRAYYNLQALVCLLERPLPLDLDVAAFHLRVDVAQIGAEIAALEQVGLLVRLQDGWLPQDWDRRQYRSDSSTGRVREHRERKRKREQGQPETTKARSRNVRRNVSRNGPGNAPVTGAKPGAVAEPHEGESETALAAHLDPEKWRTDDETGPAEEPRNVSWNAFVTPSETETETDPETTSSSVRATDDDDETQNETPESPPGPRVVPPRKPPRPAKLLAKDVRQVGGWLHEFVDGRWGPPGEPVVRQVIAALHGASLDSLLEYLAEVRERGLTPERSYAWFVPLVEERFGVPEVVNHG